MTRQEREWSRPEIGALQIAADMLGTVMERKQSEDALQQYASRLRILYQIDQAILAAASPQEIAQAAVGHIRQLIPCQQATVGVFDFETNQYIRLASDVTGEPMVGIGVSYPLEANWLDAIRQGQAFLNADLRPLPDLPPGVKDLLDRGVRSLAVVPLIVRGELLGSLNLLANEPDAFAEESIEIAREVAGQLAIAIQQARLFATERDQRTLAEALRDTASGLTSTLDPDVVMARILENVGRVVQHGAANIMLIEGDSARVVYRRGYADDRGFHEAPIGLDLPNLRRMIETSLPLVIADTASDPEWRALPNAMWVRSYAAAPLRVRGVVIGFLNLDSATPGFFTALHAERLQAFADQAAIAIENSQLYDRLRRHAAELEQRVAERTRYLQVVAEVSRQITTVLEIDRLLSQLVERTLKAFDLHDASVYLVDETRQILRYKAGARLAGQHNQAAGPSFAMPDPSAVARAALTREPVSITNAARSEDTFGTPEATDTRSELALPMIIGQQVLGVLDLRSGDASRFTPDHVHILTSLAEQMGIAVRNAQLFGELEKAQRESEILYRVSRAVNATTSYPAIIRALLDQIGVVDYSIALGIYENYNFERATYTDVMATVAPGQTEVIEPNQRFPLYVLSADEAGVSAVNDMDDRAQVDETTAVFFRGLGIEVLLSATIALGQRQIGWFAFFSDRPRKFSDFERRIIRGMADLAAAAIERSRLFAEAQAGQNAAEEANRVKSRFLANMSHELRTPLNAILNFTAFVADGVLGPINARQAEALHQSGASGRHLLSLINDILDLTKIEVGLMDLFIQEVDLNEALAVTVSVARGLVKDKPLELRTEIEEQLPHTFGDKRRIHQVFLNLVSNAIKFTPQGSVTIRASHQGNRVYVSVSDTGIGIAPEDQSLIFESFRQARHDLPEVSGTGLGLPISKFFVEAHGGVLRLESAPGKGSTFYVEFPIRSKEEADAANRAILPGG
jgi:signal transduction histidine kinase/putative methionine-R-sulfoxide reductase with GAF domain